MREGLFLPGNLNVALFLFLFEAGNLVRGGLGLAGNALGPIVLLLKSELMFRLLLSSIQGVMGNPLYLLRNRM